MLSMTRLSEDSVQINVLYVIAVAIGSRYTDTWFL